ncbi:site-specific integrase [Pseudomonas luteola]|uniref:site-specific integrase n=1 Tax=Pseudomonas luteola TaxID=47886 RepID=UPI00123C35C6|nr:site-specific integrase [Pseudomonas luteola]QEU29353.1 tyrosine-type recombinase/integrase [Pseudomonas luteola]
MTSCRRIIVGSKAPRFRAFMAQPFKHPQSGMYYFRRRVPDELQSVLGREYKRSLKTRDLNEAKARHAAEWVRAEEAFSLARAQLAGAQVLNARDIQQLAARWFHQELAELEQSGKFRTALVPGDMSSFETPHGFEEYQEWLTIREALEEGDETNWFEVVRPYVLKALKAENIPAPAQDSDAFKCLASAFREHLFRLSDIAKQREQGDWVIKADVLDHEPLSTERQRASERHKGITILKVFEEYGKAKVLDEGDNRSTQRTLADFRGTITRFVEMFGDLPVTEITRGLVQDYRAKLAKFPAKFPGSGSLKAPELIAKAEAEKLRTLEPTTVRNRLRVLSAVLGYAHRMDWIKENPVEASGVARAAGRSAKASGTRRRKDYTRAELETIFRSPVFTAEGWKPLRSDYGQALYWLPLLMYYTGARREELAQLAVKDVKTEEGIHYLSILATLDEDDKGRTVKTESSRRRVPLHDDLINRGFTTYVESLPEDGQLFPKLQASPAGYYGTNWGKAWQKYLRQTVALDSPASPSHGFRHTFKTLSRQVGISEDVHDAITGHSDGSVSRDYGSMPLSRMAEELKKYPLPLPPQST